MMFAIMRSAKCKMGDVSGIEKEVNRDPDHPIALPGSDIDWSKTKDNIYLVHSDSLRKAIKEVLLEHGIPKHRKDAVVMVDTFFSFSPEFAEKVDPETINAFFQDCLSFAEKYLGIVINARIHVDEHTFHLHVETVPLIKNSDGSYSLAAKRLMGNKADFSHRQDLFYEEVAEKYGFDKCVKQDDRIEKRIHYNTLDYKTKMRTMELERLTNEVEMKTDIIEKKEEEIQVKSEELKSINEEVQIKTGVLETAFSRIETVCKTLCEYVDHIYKSISDKISEFVDKVFKKEILTSDDFYEASLSTEEVFIPDCSGNSLYIPITSSGDRLSWDGQTPIYENYEDDTFVPYGSVDINGIVETDNLFDWSIRFAENRVIDFLDPTDKDIINALDDLSALKSDIAFTLGIKDIEKSEAHTNHSESIDQADVEIDDEPVNYPDAYDQTDIEDDDDDDSFDDVGFD